MFDVDTMRFFALGLGAIAFGAIAILGILALWKGYHNPDRNAKLYSLYLGTFLGGYIFLIFSTCIEILDRIGHPFSFIAFTYMPAFILTLTALVLRGIFVARTGRDYLEPEPARDPVDDQRSNLQYRHAKLAADESKLRDDTEKYFHQDQ